jgi:cob(I)alamin adenosyltransferase
MPLIDRTHIDYLERLIDGYNATLPPLEDFILAGGGPVALALHRCRVVCRRAERRLQTLAAAEPTGDFAMPFVNRLSDLFFVLARWAAANARFDAPPEAEAIWDRKLKPPPPPRASRRAKK